MQGQGLSETCHFCQELKVLSFFSKFFSSQITPEKCYMYLHIFWNFLRRKQKSFFFPWTLYSFSLVWFPNPDPDACQLGKTTSFHRLLSPPIISLFPFCCRHHRVQLHRSIYTNWYVEVGSWQKSFVIYASRLVPSLDPLVSCLH